jgi:uncharacterized protein YybS (DUF2232 family)
VAEGNRYPWVEIAVLAAVIFLLATSIYFRNWTGYALGLFSFTPIVLSYIYFSRRLFFLSGFLLLALFILLTGWIEAIFLLFSYLASSVIIAELLKRNRAPEWVVLSGAVPSLISGAGLWMTQAYRNHEDPIRFFREITLQNLKETVQYYERIGMDREKIEILNASLNDLASWFLYLFPGIYIAGLSFMIYLNYLLVRYVLTRLQKEGYAFSPLINWHAPDTLVWGFILSGLLVLIPLGGTKILGGNLLILFMLLYFLQGLALVAHFFRKKGVRSFWQGMTYVLFLLWPLLGLVVALFGLFDIWIDFRKVRGGEQAA